jgi:hypothetical protein
MTHDLSSEMAMNVLREANGVEQLDDLRLLLFLDSGIARVVGGGVSQVVALSGHYQFNFGDRLILKHELSGQKFEVIEVVALGRGLNPSAVRIKPCSNGAVYPIPVGERLLIVE